MISIGNLRIQKYASVVEVGGACNPHFHLFLPVIVIEPLALGRVDFNRHRFADMAYVMLNV